MGLREEVRYTIYQMFEGIPESDVEKLLEQALVIHDFGFSFVGRDSLRTLTIFRLLSESLKNRLKTEIEEIRDGKEDL